MIKGDDESPSSFGPYQKETEWSRYLIQVAFVSHKSVLSRVIPQ